MQWRTHVTAALALTGALGCSPTFDWRDLEPEDSGLSLTFPCRPDHHARTVPVAGNTTRMDMWVCSTGDTTFALSFIDVAEPGAVGAALTGLRAAAAANLGITEPPGQPLQVRGMTPNAQAVRLQLAGKRPDGVVVQQHAAFFAKALRVYQASVVGTSTPQEAVDTFLSSLRLPS